MTLNAETMKLRFMQKYFDALLEVADAAARYRLAQAVEHESAEALERARSAALVLDAALDGLVKCGAAR